MLAKWSERKFLVLCAAAHILSFGLTFGFLNAYFWDDWYVYFNQTSLDITQRIVMSGFNPIRLASEGYLNTHFFQAFRILMFIFYPIAAFCLYKILKTKSYLNVIEIRGIALLFLLAPVNSARAAVILFMYTSCMCAFFIAWYLYESSKNIALKFVAICLFIYSFDTASLIPFMALPIAMSFIDSRVNKTRFTTWLRQHFILVVIGPIFWVVEPMINPKVFEPRDSYYEPNLAGLTRAMLLLLPLLALAFWGGWIRKWRYSSHRGQIQIATGLLTTWLAIFPYMSLGHFANLNSIFVGFIPNLSDWDSRHQLLLPFGIALIILGVLNYLQTPRIELAILAIASVFLCLNFTNTQEYYLDSLKQDQVIAAIQETNNIAPYEYLMVSDEAVRFNARGRSIRTYEWDAIFNEYSGGIPKTTEINRYIDCQNFRPQVNVIIRATNGRFRALLTRNLGITLDVVPIDLCR